MDFSFLDTANIVDNPNQINSNQQELDELAKLADIADKIGSYTYMYKGTDELHDGVVAQELLQVPGLASAVKTDENGILTVDTRHVALATLGYVAALARVVLNERNK